MQNPGGGDTGNIAMFKECRHIMPSGAKCKSPALRDMYFCYFHTSLHRFGEAARRPDNEPLQIPALEDSSAVQLALTQVLDALGSSRLDPRRAGLFLYGLQIASQLAARPSDRSACDSVRSLCYEGDGETLAPEKTECEPPEDCANCPKTADCDIYDIYFDDEEEEED